MGRKTYSAKKIGHVRATLQSNAGYIKPTATQEGVAKETVTRWRDGQFPPHVTPEQVEEETKKARGELAKLWSELATKGARVAFDRLDDPKTSALQAATVGAIGTDKANLLTGQPTERVDVVDFATWLTRESTKSGTEQPSSKPVETIGPLNLRIS